MEIKTSLPFGYVVASRLPVRRPEPQISRSWRKWLVDSGQRQPVKEYLLQEQYLRPVLTPRSVRSAITLEFYDGAN